MMAPPLPMTEVGAKLERYCHNMLAAFSGRYDVNERGCWIWRGAPSGQMGYGQISFGPRPGGIVLWAHRFSWLLHRGQISQAHRVLHRCDVPLCVNPDHLFLGTQADNVADAVAKGRHRNQNTNRPHCRNGHPLSGDNVKWEGTFRRCRTCYEAKLRARRNRHV